MGASDILPRTMRPARITVLAWLACAAAGLSCATPPPPTPATYENLEPMLRKDDAKFQAKERKEAAKNREPSATCMLKATETSNVSGKLTLLQNGAFVIIMGRGAELGARARPADSFRQHLRQRRVERRRVLQST